MTDQLPLGSCSEYWYSGMVSQVVPAFKAT